MQLPNSLQAKLQSYETGEKAAEVDLLRERVHLLEEEVRTQEKKALDAAAQVDKLQKESEVFSPIFLFVFVLLYCLFDYLKVVHIYPTSIRGRNKLPIRKTCHLIYFDILLFSFVINHFQSID